jgi:DNA-directed RNA polymerase specialized sigma24 family protein
MNRVRPRTDRAFEPLYRRNVRRVYQYALAVLLSSEDAEDVTHATFLNAYRAFERGERFPDNWLIWIAHKLCDQRARRELAYCGDAEALAPEGDGTCEQAERAISRRLDGLLGRAERRRLRSHLRLCDDCSRFARGQRAQRAALRALANVPLPLSLASFPR